MSLVFVLRDNYYCCSIFYRWSTSCISPVLTFNLVLRSKSTQLTAKMIGFTWDTSLKMLGTLVFEELNLLLNFSTHYLTESLQNLYFPWACLLLFAFFILFSVSCFLFFLQVRKILFTLKGKRLFLLFDHYLLSQSFWRKGAEVIIKHCKML